MRLKVKLAKRALFSTAAWRSRFYSYPWRSSFIHLQRRHHTKRRESPLLAKEGTFLIEGILLVIRNLLQLLGSFTCRKVGTWDKLFNFPSGGRHAEDFVNRKKSNGFGRVWTRELGNQRASMRTTRPPKPSKMGLTQPNPAFYEMGTESSPLCVQLIGSEVVHCHYLIPRAGMHGTLFPHRRKPSYHDIVT
jgi:hypothetical protein